MSDRQIIRHYFLLYFLFNLIIFCSIKFYLNEAISNDSYNKLTTAASKILWGIFVFVFRQCHVVFDVVAVVVGLIGLIL